MFHLFSVLSIFSFILNLSFSAHQQQYNYRLPYNFNSTMEDFDDGDQILNVIQTNGKKSQNSSYAKSNKAQIKMEKYSKKFKLQRQKNRSLRRNRTPTMNLLPDPADIIKTETASKIQNTQHYPQKKEQVRENKHHKDESKFDRPANKKRQYSHFNQERNNQERGNQSKDNQEKGHINLNAKIQTPDQLQLEHVLHNIDTNPIEMMKLHPSLEQSLLRNNITKLTDIQMKCYQQIYEGRDVIAKASTGSGKTLAYLIPLINQYLVKKSITKREDGTIMLVICPSRQLCAQGNKEALRCLKRCPFIVPGCLIGGQQTNHQKTRIRKGIAILFCTPGRFLYHLKNTKSFKFDQLKTIIFEEADRTLDMGFQPNVNEILQILSTKLEITHLQKILVSAHFNEKVESLINNLNMSMAIYIGFNQEQANTQRKQISLAHEQQINISQNLKQQYLLMSQQERIPLMIAYLRLVKDSKVMIFANTIDQVQFIDFLLNNLTYRDSNGIFTEEKIQTRQIFKIHGDLDQKLRTSTYFEFRKAKSAILISTEVASRGLDFPDLNHIILFDVPPTITDYGNRVGRSARFNSSGLSLLMLHYQQSDYAQKIRYYSPKLQLLNKDVIYEGFGNYLRKMNIGENSLYYLEGIVRGIIKDDDEKYQLARKAYVSMLRAYAKMKDKHTFAVKKLDLKLLGRGFGINSTGGKERVYNPKAKESHLEALRKKRKVQSVKKMQIQQYL